MKNQKGMGHLMLIICIVIIIFIVAYALYFLYNKLQNQVLQTYETDMLLIQGKVKILSEESLKDKNEEILIGRKITDALEEETIKQLLEKQVISQEDSNFEKYYLLEKSNLEEMGLNTIRLEKAYYIVNYNTNEIIYSSGIKFGENTYYKLSELQELDNQKEEQNNVADTLIEE